MRNIPLSIPNLCGNELKYLTECVETNFVSSVGRFVSDFEIAFANYLGVKRAVAVVNGTAALHLSLHALGVGYEDEVLAPNLTFVAPLNAIRYLGAVPVLIDSEWGTLGMDPEKLYGFLKGNAKVIDGSCINLKTGKKIKAVIPMHTMGNAVNLNEINKIANDFKLDVIEDASEALGTTYGQDYIGGQSTVSCFSFNGNKIMTTGGGGMITTNDDDLADRLKHLSTTAKSDALHFVHDEVGFNYRMVNLLAAVGLAQLENLDKFLDSKKRNFKKYQNKINSKYFDLHEASLPGSNYWFYNLVIRGEFSNIRDHFIWYMNEKGIGVRPIWALMSDLDMFKDCQSSNLDVSRDIRARVVNIPCSTNLSDEDIEYVCDAINSYEGNV